MDGFVPLVRHGKMNRFQAIRLVLARVYVASFAAALAGLVAGALAFAPPVLGNEAGSADVTDAWRRTANGWELVNRWHEQPPRYPVVPAVRLDSHPAALALLQSLAVVVAFALFPPHRLLRSPASV